MEELVACVKSCIISRKGGIPISEFNDDFKSLVGNDVPFQKFGFKKLDTFLSSIDGVKIVHGNITATSEKTKHLEELISRQKNTKTKYKKRLNTHKTYNLNKNIVSAKKSNPKPVQPVKCLPLIDNSTKHNKQTMHVRERNLAYRNKNTNKHINYKESRCIDFKQIGEVLEIVIDILQQLDFIPQLNLNLIDNSFKYTIKGYEMVGDDCMLDFAMRNVYMHDFSNYSSTCHSKLTLNDAMISIFNSPSTYFLMCCGSVDIYMKMPLDMVINNMRKLILLTILSGKEIVVCTLPPSPINMINEVITLFNIWLRSQKCIQVIDLYPLFTNRLVKNALDRSYVSISGIPYYMWNTGIQSIVKKKLIQELPDNFYVIINC